ncbi:hypothetical protein ADIARSV_0071 [Arcticibacter svalbardensis MN12-7]|uniref:Uncharacterized protein n=1 Tax=Arcticibacter svalbardensis MN12-7 TaxID=1150600 RepID=R9GYE2_9SPHI|nr:hypothetical protein ADIARSV_0071 [Arcticibacter svalbardensis MN12-7]
MYQPFIPFRSTRQTIREKLSALIPMQIVVHEGVALILEMPRKDLVKSPKRIIVIDIAAM